MYMKSRFYVHSPQPYVHKIPFLCTQPTTYVHEIAFLCTNPYTEIGRNSHNKVLRPKYY